MIPEIVGAKGVGQSVDDPDCRYEDRRSFDVPGDRQKKFSAAGTITSARSGFEPELLHALLRIERFTEPVLLQFLKRRYRQLSVGFFPGQAVQFIDIAAPKPMICRPGCAPRSASISSCGNASQLCSLTFPLSIRTVPIWVENGSYATRRRESGSLRCCHPHIDINVTPLRFRAGRRYGCRKRSAPLPHRR